MIKPNIAINHRTFGAGLKTATRFFAGYGGRYKSMRIVFILVSLIFLPSCSSSMDKTDLIGKWVSNREMTLISVNENNAELSQTMREHLNSNLGTMAYTFTEKGTTFTLASLTPTESEMYSWEIIKNSPEQVVVQISTSWFNSSKVTFNKSGNCIGLVVMSQPYTEYFCKS